MLIAALWGGGGGASALNIFCSLLFILIFGTFVVVIFRFNNKHFILKIYFWRVSSVFYL